MNMESRKPHGGNTAARETDPWSKRGEPRRERGSKDSMSTATNSNSFPTEDGAVDFHTMIKDITCSVCCDVLQNPVSITCGHTFCQDCITKHWATPQARGFLCPECRASCPRRKMVPDLRLMRLIPKIQMGVQEKSREQEGYPFPDLGSPVQLVWTDDKGSLCFDESVLLKLFMNSKISSYPVYLLSIIGEKRRGKSFLMNYIMRALENQERGKEFSLGADSDPLHGFEWKTGTDSITKGTWIWSRPFILDQEGEKVAVYILDTEGSLDIEMGRESCIKLSALSMMLSSHLIFNVAVSLKATEMDYMEMYLHMVEEFSCDHLQYLDILIRDWHDSNCSKDDARSYINRGIEKLCKATIYPKVLGCLQRSNTRCFLFPHPGKDITGECLGRLEDRDQDFRTSLRTYVEEVVNGVSECIKTGSRGHMLTCSHLPSLLKKFVGVLEEQSHDFSTPMEMYYAIKNQRTLESLKTEMRDFLDNQPMYILPFKMKTRVSDKSAAIMEKFKDSLIGPNHRDNLLIELETHLKAAEEKFCSNYNKRVLLNGIGLAAPAVMGVFGAVGAVAGAAGAAAARPVVAAGGMEMAMNAAAGAVALVKVGVAALVGRFF